jgi:hypothetical protein
MSVHENLVLISYLVFYYCLRLNYCLFQPYGLSINLVISLDLSTNQPGRESESRRRQGLGRNWISTLVHSGPYFVAPLWCLGHLVPELPMCLAT